MPDFCNVSVEPSQHIKYKSGPCYIAIGAQAAIQEEEDLGWDDMEEDETTCDGELNNFGKAVEREEERDRKRDQCAKADGQHEQHLGEDLSPTNKEASAVPQASTEGGLVSSAQVLESSTGHETLENPREAELGVATCLHNPAVKPAVPAAAAQDKSQGQPSTPPKSDVDETWVCARPLPV